MDSDGAAGVPAADRPDASREGEVLRTACAAAAEVARHLARNGFDQAWADGADIVARTGRTTVRMVNHIRLAAGMRERVLDQLGRHLTASLINPPAKAPRS